jgi:hypothetical protein
MRNSVLAALAAGLIGSSLMWAPSSARADSILFQLGLGNVAIAGYAGPYADVLVDRTSSTTATITFTSLSVGGNSFLFGNGGSVAVNVNAIAWTLDSVTGSNAGIGFTTNIGFPGDYTDGGSGNEDGFGSFNQKVDTFDGFSHTSSIMSIAITNSSGSWAAAGDVLTPNASGYAAAAHIFVAPCATASACTAGSDALATGFATVPEPSTLALVLLGGGLLATPRLRKS